MLPGATSPISSSELEKAALGIIKLKTAFRNNMKDEQQSNINLLQIHATGSINVKEILQMFIKNPKKIVFIIFSF